VKYGKLILRKIIKIVVTRCQILRLKCIKIDFGCGSVPDPAGDTVLPHTLYWNKRNLLIRERKGVGKGKGKERRGRERRGIQS